MQSKQDLNRIEEMNMQMELFSLDGISRKSECNFDESGSGKIAHIKMNKSTKIKDNKEFKLMKK